MRRNVLKSTSPSSGAKKAKNQYETTFPNVRSPKIGANMGCRSGYCGKGNCAIVKISLKRGQSVDKPTASKVLSISVDIELYVLSTLRGYWEIRTSEKCRVLKKV